MELRPFVEGLQADLEGIAAVGDDDVAEAARRLSAAVRASAGLRLLDALGEAGAGEAPPAATGDVELVARISLRLPEALKAAVEAAAAREGVSVNTWLV